MLTYFSATLAYVRARLGELHGREQGVTAVEYALMVAIIALLLVGGFYALFNMVKDRYGDRRQLRRQRPGSRVPARRRRS